ncbi:MAG: hypothetical protein ABSD99_09665, partial [Candidatus Bathyarchaeia archaeon]
WSLANSSGVNALDRSTIRIVASVYYQIDFDLKAIQTRLVRDAHVLKDQTLVNFSFGSRYPF